MRRPTTGSSPALRGVAATGLVATLAAVAATTVTAALARAVGVEFVVADGEEPIPLPGFAVVTGIFAVVGVALAVALLRWSARPAEQFVRAAVTLTAISLLPPFLSAADAAAAGALVALHLVAAGVMIPALARGLRAAR